MTDALFRYDPPGDPWRWRRWQQELDRVAPPLVGCGFLRCVWHPGDPWEPVQRWVIYEFEPRSLNPHGWYWEEVAGPDPRARGHYDGAAKRFIASEDSMLDRLTWAMARETDHFPRPFWVVQGGTGGHPWSYTRLQQRALRQAGLPSEPPRLGSLPYAEPDRRTWEAIAFYNRLGEAAGGLNSLDPAAQDEAKQRLNAALMRETFAHIEDVYRDVRPRDADEVARVVHDEPDHMGAGFERMQERFLTGS